MTTLILGDCLEKIKMLPDNSVDSVVTDPPYGLGFMNKEWDSPEKLKKNLDHHKNKTEGRNHGGFSPLPFERYGGKKEGQWFQEWCEVWGKECLRVLKPGGHLISFSAPRMYHRMTCGLEDAGFEIRDQIMWVFGSGFPKSHNIGKAMDKLQGNEREVVGRKIQRVDGTVRNKQPNGGFMKDNVVTKDSDGYVDVTKPGSPESEKWEGWGTALKPAHEPIVVARKPLSEKTIVENVLRWGTGGLNIDDSRILYKGDIPKERGTERENTDWDGRGFGLGDRTEDWEPNNTGRWPANIIFDEEAGQVLDQQSGISKSTPDKRTTKTPTGEMFGTGKITSHNDKGGASRFFYCPKASKKDRDDMNNHPTVKPTELMLYLIKLVTPKGGTVLEPFMGSGSTGKAAVRGGYDFIGIEKEEEYLNIAKARIENELK